MHAREGERRGMQVDDYAGAGSEFARRRYRRERTIRPIIDDLMVINSSWFMRY
jgi:hypothetical protein